jgi:phosphoribosylformylglycinamidine synthase
VGAASVLAECCRNIVAVGAEPIAFLDHCQFGDPNDEQIFWAFSSAVKGMADFARVIALPCIGGKVSFYNQDEETGKAIKSSPVVTVLGLIEKLEQTTKMGFGQNGDAIIIVGRTRHECGGSEYYRLVGARNGSPPTLDFELEKRTQKGVLSCIRGGLVTACHDCSTGGLGVALAEMAIAGEKGATVDLNALPADGVMDDGLLFSESNSRFIITTSKPSAVLDNLSGYNVPATFAGKVGGNSLTLTMRNNRLDCKLDTLQAAYLNSLQEILEPWQK